MDTFRFGNYEGLLTNYKIKNSNEFDKTDGIPANNSNKY